MSQFDPSQMPDFWQQITADITTLETMLADQRAHADQLVLEAGDPLKLRESRLTFGALHQTYIHSLERSLNILHSMLGDLTPED